MAKKKSRRSDLEFPALSPQHNLKSRYNEIEDLASYADTLSKEDRAWLNAFSEEEICSNFKHNGQKLNDESDPVVRSRIYGRNNQRNRCIYTREESQNSLQVLDDLDIDKENGLEQEESYE
jgi:hypothetical protein